MAVAILYKQVAIYIGVKETSVNKKALTSQLSTFLKSELKTARPFYPPTLYFPSGSHVLFLIL